MMPLVPIRPLLPLYIKEKAGMTDLGRPRRNGKSPGKKMAPWETVPWEAACRPYPGKTDARLRLGSGVGLSSITGCSFNLGLTRCIKNNASRNGTQQPALANQTDTTISYPSRGFVLKNPELEQLSES